MTHAPAPSKHLTLWIVIAIVAAILFAILLPRVVGIGVSPEKVAASTHDDVRALVEAGDQEGARLALLAHRSEPLLIPVRLGGDIFLRLLKMIVVPLVMASVMTGILGLGDVRKLGRPGGYTILYYLCTTVLAVVVGLIVVNIIDPGLGTVDAAEIEKIEQQREAASDMEEQRNVGDILENLVLMLFTDNLFRAAVNMDLLPLIGFSILFAGLLTTMGSRVDAIKRLIEQANDVLMTLILLIMRFAPLGIFCLVAARFGAANAKGEFLSELAKTGWYSATVLIGLGIHAFVTLPCIFWIFTRKNPYRFIVQMSQALLTAFSTASSSATLPVTMESAVDRAGVSRKSVDFVLPLGATINMDGTALYEAVACIFIAQVTGVDLSFSDQLVVAVTATLAAIGAAGIPEAGLVTMVIVLTAVGLDVEYITLILSVDWLLDRFRTAVNVFGDASGAAIVDGAFPKDEATPTAGSA